MTDDLLDAVNACCFIESRIAIHCPTAKHSVSEPDVGIARYFDFIIQDLATDRRLTLLVRPEDRISACPIDENMNHKTCIEFSYGDLDSLDRLLSWVSNRGVSWPAQQ